MSNTDENTDDSSGWFERGLGKTRLPVLLFAGRRRLASVLAVAVFVTSAYLLTHPYPAFGAGLFLEIAETIAERNYAFPKHISGYTRDGVPFAYPPLAFYLIAVLLDIGVDPLVIPRALPTVATILAPIPYYYMARELLPSPTRAGVAAIIAAVTPVLLEWHLSAGGIVRGPAFLLLLCGLYVGIRLFREGGRRWLLPACALFGLTVLTHPTYAVFFGVSYVLLFAAESRSLVGLRDGATVAGAGLAIALPWIALVASNHGIGVLTSAAGTHGGLGAGPALFVQRLEDPLSTSVFIVVWYLLLALGIYYFVSERRPFLPIWFGAAVFLMDEIRFAFVPGVLLVTMGLTDVVPAIQSRLSGSDGGAVSPTAVRAFVLGLLVVFGTLFAAGLPVAGQTPMPAFIDQDDTEAMEWVQSETPSDAEFVVLGDAAEWFPYLTERTMLVGPWGVEWKTPAKYRHQMDAYTDLSACHTAGCLTNELRSKGVRPTYVYVPKGTYTVRGATFDQPERMRRSLERSERYRIAYENEGVLIVRVLADGR
ncbi:ArnT family glycosyltransferase [Haladaptatus salinisoli]|uniref:ArnT family glycosyltransferase n=1 Tax=Haladaptatus salinisoli TaxID=2884876 RepID=UPI001D0A4AD2|nr:glycosyltransferase family 39 protein [Haladaptatus salinisoli]